MRLINSEALSVVFILTLSCFVVASPIPAEKAQMAARGWLNRNTAPLETPISGRPVAPEAVSDEDGQTLYYVVPLDPEGFVILSSDDQIEPVIAFSPTGYYNPDQPSPLQTLLTKDMNHRLQAVAQKQDGAAAIDGNTLQKRPRDRASQQWDDLTAAGAEDDQTIAPMGLSSISDVRVAPFLQSQWSQADSAGGYCYNYYTPNHYPTGCVATAMAQFMRYHAWPTTGIGIKTFTIYVDGTPYSENTRGGDGAGGAYNWSQMPYIPASGLTTAQREAIGALCHDAGTAVNMAYAPDSSSASLSTADTQLISTFKYTNCIYSNGFPSSGSAALWTMINSNLDAALPVILGVDGPYGGHAVIADGYGYEGSAAYHHINMGWEGQDDTWYQLPTIDSSPYFNLLEECLYNIYTSGTGQIVSGRVTSLGGAPLENAVVRAWVGSSQVQQTATNSRGIYAFKNLASSTQHRISVTLSGYLFTDQYVTTGNSADYSASTGNKWGINFAATNASPPIALETAAQTPSTQPVLITLLSADDDLPDPNFYTHTITSLPSHGFLSEPNVGPITSVPYTMAYKQDQVLYTPCPYFGGQDTFGFKANDGGTPPTGGDSNIAAVTVEVDNSLQLNYGIDSTNLLTFNLDTSAFYDLRSQIIMLQSEIGSARYLTDLAIKIYTIPGRTLTNWTIRMQHTGWTYFPSSYDVTYMFLTGGWTTVYQSNVTITNTGWINFHFSQPFYYNGSQNLLIDLSFNNSGRTSPGGTHYIQNAGTNRVLSLASETGTHGDPLTWDFWAIEGSYYLSSYIPSMKLLGIVPIDPITADLDNSCVVNMPDLAVMAQAWLTSLGEANYNAACDLSTPKNNTIDIDDLTILVTNWLNRYPGL